MFFCFARLARLIVTIFLSRAAIIAKTPHSLDGVRRSHVGIESKQMTVGLCSSRCRLVQRLCF